MYTTEKSTGTRRSNCINDFSLNDDTSLGYNDKDLKNFN